MVLDWIGAQTGVLTEAFSDTSIGIRTTLILRCFWSITASYLYKFFFLQYMIFNIVLIIIHERHILVDIFGILFVFVSFLFFTSNQLK